MNNVTMNGGRCYAARDGKKNPSQLRGREGFKRRSGLRGIARVASLRVALLVGRLLLSPAASGFLECMVPNGSYYADPG